MPFNARAQNSPVSASNAKNETIPCPRIVDGFISACDKCADQLKAAQTLIAAQAEELTLLRERAELAEQRLTLETQLRELREREAIALRKSGELFEVRIAELEFALEDANAKIADKDKRLAVVRRTGKLASLAAFVAGVLFRIRF